MIFTKIKTSDKATIDARLAKTQYNGSEFSLLYLMGWDYFNFESMQIAEENDIVYIRFKPNMSGIFQEDYVYLPPLCEIGRLCEAFRQIRIQCDADGMPLTVISCPKEYVEQISDDYEAMHNFNLDEYLYDPQAFIALEGKKYHGKRNHLAKFEKLYGGDYIFRPYEEKDEEQVCRLLDIWQEGRKISKVMSNEEKVIDIALNNLNSDQLFADVIEYKDKIIAFSVGEITASNVGITHIEKADIDFDGAYTAIANKFASAHYSNCRLINRQEDMGIDGLRRSKMSYQPIAFAHKYVITLSDRARVQSF